MDIGKAFTYVFDDPNWIVKILIGGIVSLIPIVDFAAVGYALTALRNVAEERPNPLPEWGDFGSHFMKGLFAIIGIIIYFLPVIILACCVGLVNGLAGGSSGTTGAQGSSNNLSGPLSAAVICLDCIIGLYSLVAGVTIYAPLTRFAMSENQLSVFWDLRGNFELISKNVANYIIALLIAWVASFIAGFGVILCIIGIIFTSFWAYLVSANIFGQFWRQTQGPVTPIVPVAPVTPA